MRSSPSIRFPWIALESWFHRFVDSSPSRSRAPAPPKFGLALSCGGARGLAHVGAIQVLEEEHIPIAAIAGSSMGAYVGALWAAGIDGPGLEKLAGEVKDRRTLFRLFVDPVIPPLAGFIRGNKARKHLERTLGNMKISELQKPMFIMATELDGLNGGRAAARMCRWLWPCRPALPFPGIARRWTSTASATSTVARPNRCRFPNCGSSLRWTT